MFFNFFTLGVSPDKQTPRRSKLLSGSGGNGGQQEDNASAGGDATGEELSKTMEEKLSNNGNSETKSYKHFYLNRFSFQKVQMAKQLD